LTFTIFIFHILDFLMDRILDLSIWETLAFVADESAGNFIYLLEASGIPLWIWICAFIIIFCLPLIGIGVYRATELLVRKKPFLMGREWFLQIFFCVPAALFLWDYSASRVIHPDSYTAFIKSLPWKMTFLQPKNTLLSLPGPILEPMKETEAEALLALEGQSILAHRPNIYIFVIESLREDMITQEIAPNMSRFKNENIHFETALSNANSSAISWFSIFHSQLSLFWNHRRQGWNMGSPALKLLKQKGYQIRAYSSADLGYYGMEQLLFGANKQLLDSYQTFAHLPPTPTWQADKKALSSLMRDLKEDPSLQEGQLIIVFWDSTHFDYSWPRDRPAKFTPFSQEFDYFKIFPSKQNIQEIKNRYMNSVNYVDTLFGKFYEELPRRKEAIVILFGDHGEEFFEHGHLFHNSHLVHEQMSIPLYFKFGDNSRRPAETKLVSQIDIFPSIFDYLGVHKSAALQGESIFSDHRWPYVLVSRFNAARGPYEFCLHNGSNKMVAQFSNRADIFQANSLRILSMRNAKEKNPGGPKDNVEKWVKTEFGEAFSKLFVLEPFQ
jgi:glucan phosphoethanolaminetransferase (alkaline phosphatase superfamily)